MSNREIELPDIEAVILAGGMGTRLRSLALDRSKVMVEVKGRPFITYLLDQLDSAGLRKVILCTGYMAYSVESMLGDKYKNLEIIYSKENEPLGTAGALRIAIPYMHVEHILVMNGDSFVEFDMNVFFSSHVKRQASVSIVLTKVEDVSRYGEIEVNSDGEVKHFTEKGNRTGAGWINAGVYLMKKDALCSIPDKTPLSLEKQFFPSLVKEGLYGYKTNERFIDIGTTESFHAAGELL